MRTVTAPDGTEHTIRIEWIGNRLRRAPADLRRRMRATWRRSDALDVADGCMHLDDLLLGVLVLVGILLFVFVLAPTLFGLVEALVVVVLAAGIWALRVLFGRPWRVTVRGPADVLEAERLVVGWRRAHATMVDAADEVARSGTARLALHPGDGVLPGEPGSG
ncbi:hypothetical protein [Dermatobacter hominis]|uniref:hypothetical protein n=1 Tax=Dermatobacter hominis TaxID=2884263 RepID=UPI001D12B90E|nr:hypothetical protein [Dermatobacter hominis]UDY35603.1 hypothetical protein LH044_20005 [Dermatobacter hominis]